MQQRMNQNTFTHFISIPFILQPTQGKLSKLQDEIFELSGRNKILRHNNPKLFHITISMLTLNNNLLKKANQIFNDNEMKIKELLKNKEVKIKGLGHFCHKRGKQIPYCNVSSIYMDIDESNLTDLSHFLIREFIKEEIIDPDNLKAMNIGFINQMYKPLKFHLTMFRVDQSDYSFKEIFDRYKDYEFGTVQIDYVDISTRFNYGQDGFYTPSARIVL